ncbi:ABC transporter ATP-binding protein [Thermophagus xiamenensis]|uniref:ABC-type multidrug transport system, ATPase component n=1 Tax=Thermophagus xiamenensis TaxID=385682 RepID=A0A1I2F655_9BACT|nr:ABC transporter ATP-binding protein [Thermophagus xiamenensis]SFF00317.1 ABC-type multidrug transport system, ATPase component [Thermophagus xiamenensis]
MVTVSGVSKYFGNIKALRRVSFQVEEGELFGVIGPDGAGKSTLFRIILSLLLPDEGEVCLWGKSPVADYKAIRRMVGYMPGKFSLYEDLTVEENLNFFAAVFGTTIKENYHLIKDIYRQIEPFKKRRAGKLSGGMKQKLALSCALIHKPKLLVLDEPTTGVDAVSRSDFWEMLQKLKNAGITVLVSTPYMDEASLCDRVALIQKGHILEISTPDAVTQGFGKQLFGVAGENMYKLLLHCRKFYRVESVYPFGEELHLTFHGGGDWREELIRYLYENGLANVRIRPIKPNIEDRFMSLMSITEKENG